MASLTDKLPTILVLGVLVGIFIALRRHVRSPRLNLWIAAWGLIFIHFCVQLFEPPDGDLSALLFIADQGSLQLSALFFIGSLTSFLENGKLTAALLTITGVPVMGYVFAEAYNCDWRSVYIAFALVLFFGTPLLILLTRKPALKSALWIVFVVVAGCMSIAHAWRHDYDFGFLAILTIGFGMPGFLFFRRYTRWSPGVITSGGGFLLWAAVFPLGQWLYVTHPNLHVNPELYNTPKLFVAFGMIVTLLEEKSEYLKAANRREHQISNQMQRFASITSRLLNGSNVGSLCQEIAQALSETSTFRRVLILLSKDGKTLVMAGHAGMDSATVALVQHNCAKVWRLENLPVIYQRGGRLGETSVLVRAPFLKGYQTIPSQLEYPQDCAWQSGDKVFIPLQSARGAIVGCISMDEPRDPARVNAEELSNIEMLAGDLAVTVDNAALHRQLVRSEKLAAMGQLVAGVAHELNNPLTSIVGYSELMADEVQEEGPRQKLEKMMREAQRMRRIIENLLRFARQNSLEKKSANLEAMLNDVLSLREYHIRSHAVDVQLEVEPQLPQVAVDEDQFKQILLNLLNNAIDALEGGREKRIHIQASRRNDRVVLHFDDTGPGFSEPHRVFDPFYTTKPVGKGTGLGLSICYGIVKEHGGEIHAVNLQPHGGRIALELPLYASVALENVTTV
jgi:signal transduction histidine kinase